MVSKLKAFMDAAENFHSREAIVNGKFFLELRLAAADNGYFLGVYIPDVDRDGFDVILEDGDSLRKVQIKTVMKDSQTKSWELHKALLRPPLGENEVLGFESSPEGVGYGGAFVLIEIDAESELKLRYFYIDVFVLAALSAGAFKLKNGPQGRSLDTIFEELREGKSHEPVVIRESMLLEVKDAGSLLGILGLHGPNSAMMWSYHLTSGLKLDESDEKNKALCFKHAREVLARSCVNIEEP